MPLASVSELEEAGCCPITQLSPVEPVLASDGQVYEREALEQWIAQAVANNKSPTSPLTRAVGCACFKPWLEYSRAVVKIARGKGWSPPANFVVARISWETLLRLC